MPFDNSSAVPAGAFLAPGDNIKYEPLEAAQMRTQAVQQGQQNLATGAQDLQAKTYANQETAIQLREQQAMLDAWNKQSNGAAGPAAAAAPAASADRTGATTPKSDPGEGGGAIAPAAPAAAGAPSSAGLPAPATGKPAGGDFNQWLSDIKPVVRPSTYFGVVNSITANQQKLADLDQKRQETISSQAKLQDDENDQFARMAKQLQDGGYKRPDVLTHLLLMKTTPSYAAHADSIAQAIQADPDNLKTIIDSVASHASAPMVTAQARETTAATGADKQTNEAGGQLAATAQKQRENTASQLIPAPNAEAYYAQFPGIDKSQRALLPDFDDPQRVAKLQSYAQTPQEQVTTGLTANRDANTVANDNAMRQQGNARLGLEAQGLAVRKVEADPFGTLGLNPHPPAFANSRDANGQPLTGDAFLSKLPAGYAAEVKAVASGAQTNLPRGKELIPFMADVNQYDNTYTQVRGKMRAAFAVGKQGQNIGNLNTAAVHAGQAADIFDAMNNHSFQPGNQAYNYVVTKFGSAAATNYNTVKTALAGEMASALKGNATDPEIAHVLDSLNTSASPAQASGALKANLHVLGAKLNTYDEQYHQTVGKDDPWSPVLPAARAVFNKNGIRPLAADAVKKTNPFR
jgi:hypothetical protein